MVRMTEKVKQPAAAAYQNLTASRTQTITTLIVIVQAVGYVLTALNSGVDVIPGECIPVP